MLEWVLIFYYLNVFANECKYFHEYYSNNRKIMRISMYLTDIRGSFRLNTLYSLIFLFYDILIELKTIEHTTNLYFTNKILKLYV